MAAFNSRHYRHSLASAIVPRTQEWNHVQPIGEKGKTPVVNCEVRTT